MSWTCTCGARNAKKSRVCEDCGAEQGRTTPAPQAPRPKPPAPWELPLCEHVQVAGTMCPDCEARVLELKAEFFRHLRTIHTTLARSTRSA